MDGSASWFLSKTGPRIVRVRRCDPRGNNGDCGSMLCAHRVFACFGSVGELVRLALGEVQTVEELESEAQKTLSAMAGGCVVYVATEDEARGGSQSNREAARETGLGLGLECVVGWKTAGPKLMVFVGKPTRQLAKERRAAFGLCE